jgi:hypothetical protein
MNIRQRIYRGIATAALGGLALLSAASAAAGDWTVSADAQAIYGSYSGSPQRSSIAGGGLILRADYLDKGGFSLAANQTRLAFRQGNNISQQSYYANTRYRLYFDALPGALTVRLDGHLINNDDRTGNTDGVRVIAPQLSFLNYAKTFYADFGYARSSYRNNLHLDQFTPTLGFGFSQGANWLQLRGYLIRASNSVRAQGKSGTTAVDVKWSHWFAPGAWHGVDKLQLGALFGERIYAVENDAAAVYNLADVQRGTVSLALQWRLGESMRLMLMGGNERYLNSTTGNSYNNRFAYVDISGSW